MRSLIESSVAAALAALVFVVHVGVMATDDSETTTIYGSNKCNLYLAPSTIPGAGLGIFTSIPLPNGTPLPAGGDGIIPISDMDHHNDGSSDKEDYHWIISEYSWSSKSISHIMEYEADKTSGYGWGYSALPNCHFWMNNVQESAAQYNTLGYDRSNSPGAGAFTGYYNRMAHASEDIAPGHELFVSYGIQWFITRENYMGLIPREEHYEVGEAFVEEAAELFGYLFHGDKEDDEDDDESEDKDDEEHHRYMEEVTSDIWDMIVNQPYKSRPLAALPKTYTAAIRAMEVGITQTEEEMATRSIEYLEEHGRCLDNMKSGNSTIPHAGRGAFATRFLPMGTVVSSAPLLHIPDRDILIMYDDSKDNDEKRDKSKPIGHQLLLNYCFGHPSSSLLLCPYSHGTPLINHNSQDPNVKIQWAAQGSPSLEQYHNSSWLNEPVTFFDSIWNTRLMFEYVALRDIQEGEEVLVDYGKEWEEAWNEHVKTWKPVENYISPHELNTNFDIPLQTHEENEHFYDDIEGWYTDKKGKEHVIHRITARRPDPRHLHTNSFVYDLQGERDKVFNDVPRSQIHFYHKPYKADNFLKGSFRHEMMIPDEMFPDAWRNLE